MKRLFQIVSVIALFFTVSPAFAAEEGGHGAPAPEIGASVVGMMLAGGLVAYLRKRRK
jgi:LPXTG-motif cell wall-anchored protein